MSYDWFPDLPQDPGYWLADDVSNMPSLTFNTQNRLATGRGDDIEEDVVPSMRDPQTRRAWVAEAVRQRFLHDPLYGAAVRAQRSCSSNLPVRVRDDQPGILIDPESPRGEAILRRTKGINPLFLRSSMLSAPDNYA